MNATSLYVTTSKVIINSDENNPETWKDLYRLLPYLRNSVSCVVCLNLLVDPYTPMLALCQHHICKLCQDGKKKIKPGCVDCKDYDKYVENKRLKVLMQMYKQMCIVLLKSTLFEAIRNQAIELTSIFSKAANNLIEIAKEGAAFQDIYKSLGGLPKEMYSILPFVHTKSHNTSNQPVPLLLDEPSPDSIPKKHTLKSSTLSETFGNSGNITYSVVYPGTGNKITIKRRPKDAAGIKRKHDHIRPKDSAVQNVLFKRPHKPKSGCRCGNATVNPGKLTCCGQRCPCYSQGGPCLECKCRGCRNPHRSKSLKVLPYVTPMENSMCTELTNHHSLQPVKLISPNCTTVRRSSKESRSSHKQLCHQDSVVEVQSVKLPEYSEHTQDF